MNKNTLLLGLSCFLTLLILCSTELETQAQDPTIRYGTGVPPAVRSISDRGLRYLASTQLEDGSWPGGQNGAGITGICLMAFMASGEDPDFGPYAINIRRALRNMIMNQNATTGYMTGFGRGSMYHHGFATLALSEAYGAVSEDLLWKGTDVPTERRRTIGKALELAVGCALTAQEKNPWGAWRYSPQSQDADTTVAGTVLMGILGARNAGIEVPNEAVDKALNFFQTCTMRGGGVAYQPMSSHGDGVTRAAIGHLFTQSVNERTPQNTKPFPNLSSVGWIRIHAAGTPSTTCTIWRRHSSKAILRRGKLGIDAPLSDSKGCKKKTAASTAATATPTEPEWLFSRWH